MPDDNTQTTTNPTPIMPTTSAPVSDTVVEPVIPEPVIPEPVAPEPPVKEPVAPEPVAPATDTADTNDTAATTETAPAEMDTSSEVISEVANKIIESHNILIALSSDPSVDEMACAIGLSLYLDKLGKRATAIYSGSTPNALEFLKPEETFEDTADTLQDFVIALNKEKADHLRYKLDGDFVKIYITPYKARLSEEDLEFSYGDFNVDLVLALDVANGIDLDTALREHGRIMHDAVVVNITTGKPGKLGEIEWSDKAASSVSEMVATLLYGIKGKAVIEKEEATAFLTGIVAATNRFSSASTTSATMKLASRLMESGANQQLISKNITPDIENELLSFATAPTQDKTDADPTKLDIEHGNEEGVDEDKIVDTPVTEKESTLLEDLKAAEASLAEAGAETTPEATRAPIRLDDTAEPTPEPTPEPATLPTPEPEEKSSSGFMAEEPAKEPEDNTEPVLPTPVLDANSTEKVITPSADFNPESLAEGTNKYGQMLEEAISEDSSSPVGATAPIVTAPEINPAASIAPSVPSTPEINGVPEIDYMPLPGDEVLPPPPAPPVDFSASMPEPPMPSVADEPEVPVVPETPEAPAAPAAPVAPLPDAFKIPGM